MKDDDIWDVSDRMDPVSEALEVADSDVVRVPDGCSPETESDTVELGEADAVRLCWLDSVKE